MTLHQKIFTIIATLAAISLVVIVALAPRAAHAQTACAPRDGIVKTLQEQYKEKSMSLGIVNGTSVVELFTSPGGKTWSITVTEPNGRTCFLASGSDWTEGVMEKEGSAL